MYFNIIIMITILILLLLILFFSQESYKPSKSPKLYKKLLWLYWDTNPMPPILEKIKKYNHQKLLGWDVHYLHCDNLKNYIHEKDFPKRYSHLNKAHQSDWIRLFLLYQYGGCWLDVGIIINQSQALDDIYQQSLTGHYDISLFQSQVEKKTWTHFSGTKIPLVIDNWFILAPQNSVCISLWLKEVNKAMEIGFYNYKKHVLNMGTNISFIHFTNEKDTYLTQHVCIQHILQSIKKIPKILFFDSYDSMFRLQQICNHQAQCMQHKFDHDQDLKKLPFIKLTSANRKNLDLSRFI